MARCVHDDPIAQSPDGGTRARLPDRRAARHYSGSNFLPAITFLIAFPRVQHGRAIGFVALPLCALLGSRRPVEARSRRRRKPWGIFNILNVAALLVLLVIAGYTGLFLALLTLKL